ncbi:bystin [Zalerion maritima]|uniref:Bystin n=1 Tax=Zalerion maritima TaxID=339359 RepID=A0AAD5RUJ9_9PEZI|nr:bystin [Zalerion maritima]
MTNKSPERMPKTTTPRGRKRHNPLEDDILATGPLRQNGHKKRKSRDENESQHVDSKQSKTVLELSRILAGEDQEDSEPGATAQPDQFGLESRFGQGSDKEIKVEEEYEEWDGIDGNGGEDDEIEQAELDPKDREDFDRIFPPNKEEDDLLKYGWDGKPKDAAPEEGETRNLGDIIMQKIREVEGRQRQGTHSHHGQDAMEDDEDVELDPKIAESMEKLGLFLSRYKSGKVPKLVGVLPQAPLWEEYLEIANHPEWSPHAVERVTRTFISAKGDIAATYLENVLLPRFRQEIGEFNKVHRQIYNAIEKSLFKSVAFFTGFLFPLVFDGCTVKEAKVIASIMSQNKIPLLTGCVGLEKMCEVAAQEASSTGELASASNMFIKTLIEKRYAMPFQVIDSLVFHFLRTRSTDPASVRPGDSKDDIDAKGVRLRLPLVWHEALHIFAELYKNDITEDQREELLDLLQTHGHPKFASATRKELLAGRGRGVPAAMPDRPIDGDDTMMIDG